MDGLAATDVLMKMIAEGAAFPYQRVVAQIRGIPMQTAITWRE